MATNSANPPRTARKSQVQSLITTQPQCQPLHKADQLPMLPKIPPFKPHGEISGLSTWKWPPVMAATNEPVTSRMVNIVEMKQRVAATEEKIKAAHAQGEQQSKRLLDLLQAVETNLARNRDEIRALRAEHAAAKDEIEQLRNMLHATLSLTEIVEQTRPSLPNRDLEGLLKRLDEIVETAGRDFDELFGQVEPPEPGDPNPVVQPKKKRRSKGFKKIFS